MRKLKVTRLRTALNALILERFALSKEGDLDARDGSRAGGTGKGDFVGAGFQPRNDGTRRNPRQHFSLGPVKRTVLGAVALNPASGG